MAAAWSLTLASVLSLIVVTMMCQTLGLAVLTKVSALVSAVSVLTYVRAVGSPGLASVRGSSVGLVLALLSLTTVIRWGEVAATF